MDSEKTPGRKKFDEQYTPQLPDHDRKNSVPLGGEVIKPPPRQIEPSGRKWFGGR